METRFYESEGSKCGQCGSDLGRQKVWTLVYSDDPPDIVERARNGSINWARCNHPNCGFEGGWLWPNPFLFIDVQKQRAVCVTIATTAAQQVDLLRKALDSELVRQRSLDPELLLKRTKFVNDYRSINEGLEVAIESLEMENTAILRYLERKYLSGKARIDALIAATLESGALILEGDETSAEFLSELEEYQSTITGLEDSRAQGMLKQIIDHLRARVNLKTETLPSRDGESALADVLRAARASAQHMMAKASFERNLAAAESEALQLRLARLCELQSRQSLNESAAAPIDARPELLQLAEAVMVGERSKNTSLALIDASVLPEVKTFLKLRLPPFGPVTLPDYKPDIDEPPAPPWIILASQTVQKILASMATGAIPQSAFEGISDVPLAQACVAADLARILTDQNQLSGAMLYLKQSLGILDSAIKGKDSFDYWTARVYAVSLERMGDLQLRFGRLEESMKAMHAAQTVCERIGAWDGLLHCLNAEAAILLDLGQVQQAEKLFTRLVRETEGRSRADEIRHLANLANVYRLLHPYAEAEVKFGPGNPGDSMFETENKEGMASAAESEPAIAPEAPFDAKAGIRVSSNVEGHEELSYRDMVGSEPIRLLFRALAIARLNGDASFESLLLSRLAAVYNEHECHTLADLFLDKLLEKLPLEKVTPDALILILNRLSERAGEQDTAGEAVQARATREEMLQVLSVILRSVGGLSAFVEVEMRGEKAALLEAVGRWEEARQEYLETIERLERSRGWMRDPENKKGLQSRRWKPHVRGARNALRMYADDSTRDNLLCEVWQLTQTGRSRALLDSIGAEHDTETDNVGVASVRPDSFSEVSGRLPSEVAVLEYFLMPTSPGCPGSWAMMIVEPDASTPWLAWQEPDMERVLEAKNALTDLADEYEKNIVYYGAAYSFASIEQQYIAALEKLADVILPAGLVDQLNERGYRKLVIVADAYLHEVPFTALRPIQGGQRVYLGLPNEGRGFQIVYAPSSSIFTHWVATLSARTPHQRRAALFVDPLGDLANANSGVLSTFNSIENCLGERRVANTRFDGARATPRAWIDEVRSHDLVVYFGHSVAGQGAPDRSALMLNDGSGSPAPMSAGDVYRESSRKLFSEHSLIIFASCSGGRLFPGAWDSDRELTGLSVAHLHAGCGATIAASRPLLDAPTLVMLEALVGRILKGDDAITSLTEAQREMAESQTPYRHPHFWGYLGLMGVPHWRFDNKQDEEND